MDVWLMRPSTDAVSETAKPSSGHVKRGGVKKSFRKEPIRPALGPTGRRHRGHNSRRWQHQFGPQSSDRRVAKRKIAAVKGGEIDHNGQPQPRTGLRLIQALAPARDLRALRRR